MKYFISLFSLLLAITSLGQTPFEIKEGKVAFAQSYTVSGLTQEQIMSKAKTWLLQSDTSQVKPAELIKEDKKAGQLLVTRSTRFDADKDRAFVMVIKWQLVAKPDGYALTMLELKGYQSLRINDRLNQQPIDYHAIIIQEQGGSGPYKPQFYNKYGPLSKQHIMDQADALFAAVTSK